VRRAQPGDAAHEESTGGDVERQLGGLAGLEVGEEHMEGRAASVDVKLTVPIVGSVRFVVRLVDEDGAWRVRGGGRR
jgi:hypothetical protein